MWGHLHSWKRNNTNTDSPCHVNCYCAYLSRSRHFSKWVLEFSLQHWWDESQPLPWRSKETQSSTQQDQHLTHKTNISHATSHICTAGNTLQTCFQLIGETKESTVAWLEILIQLHQHQHLWPNKHNVWCVRSKSCLRPRQKGDTNTKRDRRQHVQVWHVVSIWIAGLSEMWTVTVCVYCYIPVGSLYLLPHLSTYLLPVTSNSLCVVALPLISTDCIELPAVQGHECHHPTLSQLYNTRAIKQNQTDNISN